MDANVACGQLGYSRFSMQNAKIIWYQYVRTFNDNYKQMLLLILGVNLVREQVPSLLTTLAVLEMKIDYLTVLMTCTPLTAPMLRMLDSDAVEDVSFLYILR